jgi:hypothetical protein
MGGWWWAYPHCADESEDAGARCEGVVEERPECAVGRGAGECEGEGEEGVRAECEGREENGEESVRWLAGGRSEQFAGDV